MSIRALLSLKVLAFLAPILKESPRYLILVGGEPQGEMNTFLGNKNGKEKLESLFSFCLLIFAYCMVKELFVRLTRQPSDCLFVSSA